MISQPVANVKLPSRIVVFKMESVGTEACKMSDAFVPGMLVDTAKQMFLREIDFSPARRVTGRRKRKGRSAFLLFN